jgi:hypothetical protein
MSSIGYVLLGILTLIGGFVASLVVASIPDMFGWDHTELRAFICFFMTFIMFVGSSVGCGLLISEAYNKRNQK